MPGVFSPNEYGPPRKSGQIATAVVTLLFLGLAARLYYFQVIEGAYFQAHSERNSIRAITLEAARGMILDRQGKVFAENRISYTIAAIPGEISNASLVSLARLLGKDLEELREKLRDPSLNQFRPVAVQRDASFETVSRVEEHLIELPGVTVQIEPTRAYPRGFMASHLLGYVAEVNKDQLEQFREYGYQAGDLIGKNGVEKAYERFLRGKNGLRYVEVNVRGQELGLLKGMKTVPPVPGQNVYLTIDARVQEIAERAIPDSLAGALVALDPNNGAVLAFVSKPNYDPNPFPTGIPKTVWDSIRNHPLKPLLNRASDGLYPSASTMKIITGAAALEAGVIGSTDVMVSCGGGFQYGNRWARCWQKGGHGALAFIGAFTHSCDVYFYQAGLRVGLERWAWYARGFGLGSMTGIDTQDERNGLIPDKAYYTSGEGRTWSPGKMLNLAIGQGEVLVTPLQMAVVAAAVANGGTVYSPYVLHHVTTPREDVVMQGTPSVKGKLPLSWRTITMLQEAMVSVVNHGTGGRARLPGIQVAGKTGTAQNPHGEDHSWFIGYAPADRPQIAVAAIVENAAHGTAVPIVRQVLEAYLLPDAQPAVVSARPVPPAAD
jgi:penicillin-binding protein 2